MAYEKKQKFGNRITRGKIALFSKCGEMIQIRLYNSKQSRVDILDGWKKMYAKKFKQCYYHILPETNNY